MTVAAAGAAGANLGTATGTQNAASNLGQAAASAAAGLLFGELRVASSWIVAVVMLIIAVASVGCESKPRRVSDQRIG